jgi:ABC-type lipoprotein release transport system permease subunit
MVRRWRGLVGMMVGVGIALGIGMTLLGVSGGERELFTGDFTKSGANLCVVTEGGTLVPILPSDTPGTIKHANNVLARVRALPDVQAAIGLMTFTLPRDREGPRRPDQPTEIMSVMGVDGDPSAIPDHLIMKEGRWLRGANKVVLGPRLAKEKGFRVGDPLRLAGREFTVVGIGKLRGLGYGFSGDTQVYMDMRAFRDRADIGNLVNSIAVATRRPDLAAPEIEDIGSLAVYTPADLVRALDQVNAAAVVVYWLLITLTMSIAGLFVSSMLNHSVAERRFEFATLRAIGIPSRAILQTVAAEAIAVSLVAGVIGTAMSLALGTLANVYYESAFGFESIFKADVPLFLIVFALALGLGVVAGLMPARRATRVDPVEVLREA